MPCCKSTPSQIALSCTLLCIALCTVVIALSTLPSVLLTNFAVYECVSFYLQVEHLVTDVPLSASQLQLDSNTINVWEDGWAFRYQRHINQTANSTWHMSIGYTDYTGSFFSTCDSGDIQGTVWFCIASDVPSASCLNASLADYPTVYGNGVYDFGFGISLWDSSSSISYYYIFDQYTSLGMPCVERSIYDSTTSLFDLWGNHHNCKSKTIAALFSFCFCGVQLIPIFVGCVCLFRCIIKYCKKKRKERLLRSYPNFDAVNRIQSQPPPFTPTQYQQRLPNTVNYPVAFIVTQTPYSHPSRNSPSSGNSNLPRYSVLQRIPYRILSITPDMINIQKLVVNRVAPKWKNFAILLGFDQHLIDIIDCDARSCQDGCREMFTKWLRVAGGTGSMERTWETIVATVERMEDFSFASELADNLCSLYR